LLTILTLPIPLLPAPKDRLCEVSNPILQITIIDQYGNSLTLAKVKGCADQIKRHDGIAWLLMDMFLQARYSCQYEANFIFRDDVSDQIFRVTDVDGNHL